MADQHTDKRRKLVFAAARRILDVRDDAPVEELKAALEGFGIRTEAAVQKTSAFIREHAAQLLRTTKERHETEVQAFREFQDRFAAIDIQTLTNQIAERIKHLPLDTAPEFQAYYRNLTNVSSEDKKSELLDLLWQLEKIVGK